MKKVLLFSTLITSVFCNAKDQTIATDNSLKVLIAPESALNIEENENQKKITPKENGELLVALEEEKEGCENIEQLFSSETR